MTKIFEATPSIKSENAPFRKNLLISTEVLYTVWFREDINSYINSYTEKISIAMKMDKISLGIIKHQ